MSCHDIGRGLNTVTKKVIELYDEGKIQFEDVKNLLFTIRKAVYHCDGNEYEAVAYLYGRRCGHCLKRTSDLYNLDEIFVRAYEDKSLDTDEVCEECFGEFCRKHNTACDENVLAKCKVDPSRYVYWSSWTHDTL